MKTALRKIIIPTVLFGIAFVLVSFAFAFFVGTKTSLPDWAVFWNVSIHNPYEQYGFLNPYWASWILAPLHLITNDTLIAYGIWSTITLISAIFVLKDDKFLTIAGIASPYFMHQIINGQIDGIVLIGYYLLTQSKYQWIGPTFMIIKPQTALGAVIVWGYKNIRQRTVIYATTLMTILVMSGFALYGNWIADMLKNISSELYQPVNAAAILYIPLLGIVLLVAGLYYKNIFLGGLATLFLTPYIAMHSLWVYWTMWLMEKPNKKLVALLAIVNWYIALKFTV